MNKLFLHILIITFGTVFTTWAFAEDKAPAPFTDSHIERKLEDGKIQKFDGNKYKIVRRGVKKKKPAPKVVTVTKTIVKKAPVKKNRVRLMVGYGPNELRSSPNRADLDYDPVMAVGYSRQLDDTFSFEATAISSETYMLGVGVGF